jgi:hypothetical protein
MKAAKKIADIAKIEKEQGQESETILPSWERVFESRQQANQEKENRILTLFASLLKEELEIQGKFSCLDTFLVLNFEKCESIVTLEFSVQWEHGFPGLPELFVESTYEVERKFF